MRYKILNSTIHKTLNIPDVLQDERFDPTICTIFCGLGIQQAQTYEISLKAIAETKVTHEVLSYHATARLEEVQELLRCEEELQVSDDLSQLEACFNVAQMMFAILKRLLSPNRRELPLLQTNHRRKPCKEQVMTLRDYPIIFKRSSSTVLLFTRCIAVMADKCRILAYTRIHNFDNFEFIRSNSPLAQLYSTSTMEHHHFDQCTRLLNSEEGSQILSHLSSEEYRNVVSILEDAILATDLPVYYKAMLMTACDIAAITKPWEIQKKEPKTKELEIATSELI
ncbi:cGMP-specific 3',5'-cyclic phosphodiesterase [Caerostris extrusa]|uniref:cGMP-specific 3',5'-cyclic phosphodiesterase n=1 Tax=Caerostris extrusa TaxID=172846 RepID=A0AAV4NTI4_CAEEX|nr:cGMP-specific 3',5'-cyclic phosphodiesterase [Caerostris extrusa]